MKLGQRQITGDVVATLTWPSDPKVELLGDPQRFPTCRLDR
ncbi:hypothetical protein [Ralstonia pickettii]|nr:hypothetical protein [Ralstonia pickettii]